MSIDKEDHSKDILIATSIHDQKIYSKLNIDVRNIQKYYPDDNLLGIYFDEENEETYVFVIPTFEHLCEYKGLIEEDIEEMGKTYYVRDIRLAVSATRDKYPEFIKSLYSPYVFINPKFMYVYNLKFNDQRDKIKAAMGSVEPCDELKDGIRSLFRAALLMNSMIIKFLKELTDIEKVGLERLIESIGEEGIFSQSNLASDIGMSRLAMTNLVQKLEDFDMAEIRRLGRGGTYCRFKNPALMDMRGRLRK